MTLSARRTVFLDINRVTMLTSSGATENLSNDEAIPGLKDQIKDYALPDVFIQEVVTTVVKRELRGTATRILYATVINCTRRKLRARVSLSPPHEDETRGTWIYGGGGGASRWQLSENTTAPLSGSVKVTTPQPYTSHPRSCQEDCAPCPPWHD